MMTPEERAHLLGTICGSTQKIAANLIQSFVNDIRQKNAEIEARDAEIRRLRTMIADHECSGVPFGEAYKRKPKEKRTNLEWLASNPERLVEALYCPHAFCRHETELTIDNTDICRKCLLDWLKEEHEDD